jgi:hypothetical protein
MLLSMIVMIVIVGVVLYLLNTLVPMEPRFRTVVNALIGLFVFLYVLHMFGILPGFVQFTK